MNAGEKLTCGHFSDNGMNFVFGSNQGTLFMSSIKTLGRNRVEATYCRIENISKYNQFDDQIKQNSSQFQKLNSDLLTDESIEIDRFQLNGNQNDQISNEDLHEYVGITSITFPFIDPIGTVLIAFDDGKIKVWQSSVRNEQLMKILELQQSAKQKPGTVKQPVAYDISEVGYQQFDMMDDFDLFANPHGLEEVTDENKKELKILYQGKKYKNCIAKFAPGSTLSDQYYCFVDSLQYIFIRNYKRNEIIKRIALQLFPTCIQITDFSKIKINEDSIHKDLKSKGNFMVTIGTKEGKIVIYRIGSLSHNKLFQTKQGCFFGGISSIDISQAGSDIIAISETGEIIQYDLLKKLNEEQL